MRTVIKGPEPASLIRYRHTPNASYDDYTDKRVLREHLAKEQRGLCCYCLSRITPQYDKMKVEHWHPQSAYPDEQLDYANLLGACRGNVGQPHRNQHCDASKGAQVLSRNPANPDHRVGEMVEFSADGTILCSTNQDFNRDLNCVLNLNLPFLKNNRKACLDSLLHEYQRCEPSRATMEKWLRDCNGDSHGGDLEPFCQVIVYWLRKKLARP